MMTTPVAAREIHGGMVGCIVVVVSKGMSKMCDRLLKIG